MAIFSRIIAAIIGGYLAANAVAILLTYLLPGSQVDRVVTGLLVSFLIYACAILWVFAAKTAWQAWLGILIPGLVSTLLAFVLMPEVLL